MGREDKFYKGLVKQRKLAKKKLKKQKAKPIKKPKKAAVLAATARVARVTLSSKAINLRKLKNKFRTSCCNVEIFPFISTLKLVHLKRVNKLFNARITTWF
jgi:hypothetical protein